MALQHLRSSTASKRPTPAAMSDGQLALNTNDASPGLFFKDSNGGLVKVGPVHVGTTAPNASPASGGATGNTKGEQWLDTSGTNPVFKIWDGSAWQSEAGEFVNASGDVMTGALGIIAGSAGSPGLYFSGDTNTGIYSPGADQVAISTNSSQRLLIDASGNVNIDSNTLYVDATNNRVGIGTSTPGALLEVKSTDQNPNLYRLYNAYNAGATSWGIDFYRDTDSGNNLSVAEIKAVRAGGNVSELKFGTSSTPGTVVERMRIDSSGRVGIGSTTPAFRCQIDNPVALSGSGNDYALVVGNTSSASRRAVALGVDGTSGNAVLAGYNTFSPGLAELQIDGTNLQLKISGSEKARLDSSGRLLVGTSSDRNVGGHNAKFQVEDTGYGATLQSVRNVNGVDGAYLFLGKSRGTTLGSNTIVQSGDELGNIRFYGADGSTMRGAAEITCNVDGTPGASDMPGRLVFSTCPSGSATPVERLRVGNAGDVTTFSSGTAALYVTSSKAAGTTDHLLRGYNSATSITSAATLSFNVYTNGNVQNTNNSYTAISDIKLKENIVDANSQWDDIKALQVRNYNLKEGQTHRQIGLIAQEVEPISPGLVYESPDRDAEGNDLGTVTKSVNYSVLYMKAVKALQEAMERIEVLEQRLADAGIA